MTGGGLASSCKITNLSGFFRAYSGYEITDYDTIMKMIDQFIIISQSQLISDITMATISLCLIIKI